MKNDRYRQEREEIKELLTQYDNLRNGRPNSYIEQEGFERIIEYFDEKDKLEAALIVSDYAINQYPYSAELLILKANLLVVTKNYAEALEYLNKAELIDSTDINLYILKTDAYLALDMQQKAADLLENAIETFSGEERIDLLFELSDVYDDYENFEKVFDCLALILKEDPSYQEALYKICFWTDFTGRNEESIVIHKEIIDQQPYNELAWFNLGAAYQGLKLHEKAIDAYGYCVAINDKFENAHRNMGDAFLRLRNYKDAIECLQKVLELTMPEPVLFEAIGHCFDKLENYAQARFYYKKASHMDAEDAHLHYKIAGTYMNEASWQSAVKCINTALRLKPMQPDYNLALAQSYMQLNIIDEALIHFGHVIRSRPKNITGWTELLKCMYQAELYTEGVVYAEYAFEHTDSKTVFLFYKSMFLFASNKHKEALIQLENALAINPKLIKKFIEIYPAILNNRQVADVIARFKKKPNSK